MGMYAYIHRHKCMQINQIFTCFHLSSSNINNNINWLNDLLLKLLGSFGLVILENIHMLSVQVRKCTIKLLPLLGQYMASRAIKQITKQITTAVLNIGRYYNM